MARILWLAFAIAILQTSAVAAAAESVETTDSGELHPTEEPRAWRLLATTGFETDRGIFDNTDQNSVPLVLRLEYQRWALSFVASALQIDGPASVGPFSIGGAGTDRLEQFLSDNPGIAPDDIVQAEKADEWGFADSMVSISYAWYEPESWLPFIELSAGLKIPTASTRKQLGTGKFDYLLQADIAENFGRWTPFATFGYRFNGSSYQPPVLRLTDEAIRNGVDVTLGATYAVPQPIPIRDTALASVGFNYLASASLFETGAGPTPLYLGLIYDWQENAVAGVPDTHELVGFASFEWNRNLRIGPYLIVGLSESAPDIGIATQVTVSY
ncbi:MAG: hypothetical protein VX246_00630 [Myxococcota bacterium]|nr:hypothetical protein [Myxococcota bacterium]